MNGIKNIINYNLIKGAVFGVLSSLSIVIVSSLAKEAGEFFHPVQILFFRHLFGLLAILLIIIIINRYSLLKTNTIKSHILRSNLGSLAIFFMFYSVQYLSVTEATSLFFLSPIFVLILSWPLLREKVGIYKTIFTIAGFMGALVILQPDHISSMTGAILAITAALFSGLVMICLRSMGKTENAITTIFYYAFIGMIVVLPIVPFFWVTPTYEQFIILILIGVLSSALQYCFTKSFIYLPANIAGSMFYLQIIWAIIIDLVIWGVLPSIVVIIGSAIIICSNLFILLREKSNKKKEIK